MTFERYPSAVATTTTARPVIVKPAETRTYPAGEVVYRLPDGPDANADWRTLVNGAPNAAVVGPKAEVHVGYTPPAHMRFFLDAPDAQPYRVEAITTLRGLVPGRAYTVSASMQAGYDNLAMSLVVAGIASTPVNGVPRTALHGRTVTFTATGDEEDVIMRVVVASGPLFPRMRVEGRFADVTVTGAAYTQTIPAVLSDQVAFPVHSGGVTLDSGWAPYVQGQVRVPMPTPDADTQFDPNGGGRFKITASSIRGEVAQFTPWAVERRNYVPDVDLTGGITTLANGRGTAFNIFKMFETMNATPANTLAADLNNASSRSQLVELRSLAPGQKFGISMPVTDTTPVVGGAVAVGITPGFGDPSNGKGGELWVVLRVRGANGVAILSQDILLWKDDKVAPVNGPRALVGTIPATGTAPSTWTVEAYFENRGTTAYTVPTNLSEFPARLVIGQTYAAMFYLNDNLGLGNRDDWISVVSDRTSDTVRHVKLAKSTVRETRKPAPPIIDVTDASTFDLALTGRELDYTAGEMILELASDEYLAQRYAPIADDRTPRSRESSLRSICEYVLGKAIPTVPTLGGTADASVIATWDAENLCINPSAEINTTGWSAGTNATRLTRSTGEVGGSDGGAAFRWAAGAAGISYVDMERVSVGEGNAYNVSAYFVSNAARPLSIMVRQYDAAGRIIRDIPGGNVTLKTNEWTRISLTVTIPAGVANISLHPGYQASAAGQAVWMDRIQITEGVELLPFFAGSSTPTAEYAYTWAGTAHASSSKRLALKPRDPEALVWHAGQSAWDFLSALANSVGLRLYCDEKRVWWLVNPATHTIAGTVTASAGTTLEASDRTDGERGDYADGVVITWRWRDLYGNDRIQVETAGTAGKVDALDITAAYPGAGTAAARLATLQRRASERDLTVAADFRTRPAQQITSTIPDAPTRTGRIGSVRFDLASGLMQLRPDRLA